MPTILQLQSDALWKQRYRLPVTYGMAIAKADMTRGLVTSDVSGVTQLYAWHVPTGELRQLTTRPEGAWFGYLSPDGRYVYYLKDNKGDELGHLIRVPFEGGPIQDITPTMPLYAVPFESDIYGLAVSMNGEVLGFTIAFSNEFHTYVMKLEADGTFGEMHKIHTTLRLVVGPMLSYNGEIAVLATTEHSDAMHFSLLAFDITRQTQIAELWDKGSSVLPVMFSPIAGDERLLAMANFSGFNRPLLWNPRTSERVDIPLAELEGEITPLDWSSDGKQLLLKQTYQAMQQLFLYKLESASLKKLNAPRGTFEIAYFGPNGEIFTQLDSSTQKTHLIVLDGETGEQKRVVFATQKTHPSRPFTSVSFPSSDGQSIQAWLAVPEGDGPFPTILETHGGPTWVELESFRASVQAWLDHGFAFISVNYRGSTTFGKAFEEQIWGDIGHWEVEDMIAARHWLVQQSIAIPEQIFLTGWSYGGYLTLHALGKTPDLWAGGLAGIALADCAISYEDEADTLKAYDVTIFKGTPQEKPELYKAASPITYAEQVKAPVFIIQGRNDTRCPPRSIEVYEAKMKELGKPIEVHWFDAGHGTGDVEQRIEFQELMMRFVYQVLEKGV